MAKFDIKEVGKSIWPEIGAVGIFLASRMGVTYVQEANNLTGWKNPEYYLDGIVAAGSLYLIGVDKAQNEAKAVLWAETGLVGQRAMQWAYDSTIGKKAKKIGRGKIRKGNPGGGVLNEAERARQIATQQQNALALINQQGTPVGADLTQF